MNDPPTERLTTATAVTASSPPKSRISAAASAAIPSGQSSSSGRLIPTNRLVRNPSPLSRVRRLYGGPSEIATAPPLSRWVVIHALDHAAVTKPTPAPLAREG